MMSDGDLSLPMVVMSSLSVRSLWDRGFNFEYQSEALGNEIERD